MLHREVVRRLVGGRLVVVDATNVEVAARRALVQRAAAAGRPAVAIVLALPAGVVHAQNIARIGRTVDPAVVERHIRRLELTLATNRLPGEGFAAVHVLTTPAAVEGLRIERVPTA
jgi:predicted kinase